MEYVYWKLLYEIFTWIPTKPQVWFNPKYPICISTLAPRENITKSNLYVLQIIETLSYQGERTQYPLKNMFKVYGFCADKSFVWIYPTKKGTLKWRRKYHPLPNDGIGQHKIRTTKRVRDLGATITRGGETHSVGCDRYQEGFPISGLSLPILRLLDSNKDIWMDLNKVYNLIRFGWNNPKRTQGSQIVTNLHALFTTF